MTDVKCPPVFSGGDTNGDHLLGLNETWTYTCAAHLTADTTNTAIATGHPPVGVDVTDTDTATVDVVNPALDIVKTGPAQAREGDTVTYHFAVHNTGDIPLTGVSVDDDILGHIGTTDVAVGATVTLDKTYVIPAGHAADVVNIATACVTAAVLGNTPLCDSATHTLDVLHPAIHVTKSVNKPVVLPGTTVTYSYRSPTPVTLPWPGSRSPTTSVRGHRNWWRHRPRQPPRPRGDLDLYTARPILGVDTVNAATAKGTPPVGPERDRHRNGHRGCRPPRPQHPQDRPGRKPRRVTSSPTTSP